MQKKNQIMDARQVQRTITRMAHEIIERNKGVEDVVLAGLPFGRGGGLFCAGGRSCGVHY